MGNYGLRKLISPLDLVETKYDSIHEMTALDIDKQIKDLEFLKGQYNLVVNIATDFEGYQQKIEKIILQAQAKSQQLNNKINILLFPSNSFLHETKNYQTIKNRMSFLKNYSNVYLFGKVEVNGNNIHPIYKFLKRNTQLLYEPAQLGAQALPGDFCSFLINNHGAPIKYYTPADSID